MTAVEPGPKITVGVAGESGGVGLAGLIRIAKNRDAKAMMGLNGDSRIFVVNTEGATDRDLYVRLTGLAPELVGQAS
jgi:diaminopropionate ammonia-lyase